MIKSLTSLRFFFAFAVFLSHYKMGETCIFPSGYLGVSFFFLLSGFILAYTYKERLLSGQTTKVDFYIARFARIYPLHLLLFLFSLSFTVFIHQSPDWKVTIANLFLLQSWIPDPKYYFSLNAPSWSLSCEMFFYALFPILLLFLKDISQKRWSILTFLALCVYGGLVFFIRETKYAQWMLYINPAIRISDFLIGILLYFLWEKFAFKAKNISSTTATFLEISSVLLLSLVVWISSNIPEVYTYACYWIPMSCVIFIFAIQQRGSVSRLLSRRWFVLAGEVSFGFYMLHIPVMEVMRRFYDRLHGQIPELIWFLLVFVIIFLLSLLSFYCFETPVNRLVKKIYAKYKYLKP